jgi:hypothetical protein
MDGAARSLASSPNLNWLAEVVADPRYEISLGAFGAVGQFPREPRTGVDVGVNRVAAATETARIAFTHHPRLQPIAFETLSSDPEGWNPAIALCLPHAEARMSGRTLWTPVGPDKGAIDPLDRSMACYDIGLDLACADIFIRPSSAAGRRHSALARYKKIAVASLLERHVEDVWVFETAVGRIETLHPRRRHIFANLLSKELTHSSAAPIPDGLLPVGYVLPPNPRHARSEDAASCHADYQQLLDRLGIRDLVRLKRKVEDALEAGRSPAALATLLDHSGPPSRAEMACVRIALRQRRWLHRQRDRSEWEEAYDRPLAESALSLSA